MRIYLRLYIDDNSNRRLVETRVVSREVDYMSTFKSSTLAIYLLGNLDLAIFIKKLYVFSTYIKLDIFLSL